MGLKGWLSVGCVAIVGFLLVPPSSGTPAVGIPQEGPDVPTATTPIAVFQLFDNEFFSGTDTVRTRFVTPPVPYDRVILEFREKPLGDPWDRTFGVALGNVEVLHGTTPRTDFTVRKDITAFASLLPVGVASSVSIKIDTWVGAQAVFLKLEFYANEPTKLLVEQPWTNALGVLRWSGFCGSGQQKTVTINFPDVVPTKGLVELTASGHGSQEFKAGTIFHVFVDNTEIAQFVTLPYLYAFIGFEGGTGNLLHPFMWWTVQKVLDAAGVHGGVGEIPPYRATLLPEHLALLSGTHDVSVVQQIGAGCTWLTSVSILTT